MSLALAPGGSPKWGVRSKNSQGSPLWLRRGLKQFVKGGALPFFARTKFRGGPRPLGPNGPGATGYLGNFTLPRLGWKVVRVLPLWLRVARFSDLKLSSLLLVAPPEGAMSLVPSCISFVIHAQEESNLLKFFSSPCRTAAIQRIFLFFTGNFLFFLIQVKSVWRFYPLYIKPK